MEDIDVGLSSGVAVINREETPNGYSIASAAPRITLSGLLNAVVSHMKPNGRRPAIHTLLGECRME